MSPQDTALLRRWSTERDPDAFQSLVNQYAGLVYAAGLRILRNEQDAQDIAQECFLRISEAPHDVHLSLAGWLHTMATRRAIDHLRKEKRRRTREKTYDESTPSLTEAAWDDVQEYIDEAIAALPEDLKYPIVEHYLAERTYESIGQELGVTRQAISQRVHKGVERVRHELRRKGIVIGTGIVLTGLETISAKTLPAALQQSLARLAIAGLAATQGGMPLMLKAIIATAVTALIGGGLLLSSTPEPASTPPPVETAALAPPTVNDTVARDAFVRDDAPQTNAPFLLAQAIESDQALDPSATSQLKVSGGSDLTPDFTKFSLKREFPKPDVGAITILIEGPDAAGATAKVRLVTWEPWEEVPTSNFWYQKTVSENGIAYFDNLPFGNYQLLAEGENSNMAHYCTLSDTGQTLYRLALALVPTRRTTVRPTAADGQPVAGFRLFGYQSSFSPARIPFLIMPAYVGTDLGPEGLVHLPPGNLGKWRTWVTADGYAPTLTDYAYAGAQDVEILFNHGGSLEATVIDANTSEPVEGVIVYLRGDYYRANRHGWTDENGLAHVDNIFPANYMLDIYSENYVLQGQRQRFQVNLGEVTQAGTVQVVPGHDIRGRVVDTDTGAGIPKVKIVTTSGRGVRIEDRLTDKDGYYEIPNLPEGHYTIRRRVSLEYGVSAGTPLLRVSVGPEGPQGSTDFELSRGIPILGHVVGQGGRPVAGATISAGYSPNSLSLQGHTDRHGRFRISGLKRAGSFYVQVRGMRHARKVLGPFELTDEGIADLTLELPPTATITGKVVRDVGMIRGTTLVYANRRPDEHDSFPYSRVVSGSGPVRGVFYLSELSAGTYDLSAQLPGSSMSGTLATVTVSEGEFIGDLQLYYHESGLRLSGRVVSPNGVPVNRASVTVSNQHGPAMRSTSLNTLTTEDGDFAVTGLPKGKYAVSVSHRDYSNTTVTGIAAGTSGTIVTMQQYGTVSGVVRSAATGAPIPSFRAKVVQGHLDQPPTNMGNAVSFNDPNGLFRIQKVNTGPNTLVVAADGYATAIAIVDDVQSGQDIFNIQIELDTPSILAGTIIDPYGSPVPNAIISAYPDGMRYFRGPSVAQTNDQGQFETAAIPPGDYTIAIVHPDYAGAFVDVELAPGLRTEFEVTLSGGGTLSGYVFVDDAPTESVRVNLLSQSMQSANQSASTGTGGSYTFDSIPAGSYTTVAYLAQGRIQRSISIPVIFEGDDEFLLDFGFRVPDDPATVFGVVTTNGAPLSNAHVSITIGDEGFATQTAADGSYSLDILPAGDARATVSSGNSYTSDQFQIRAGQEIRYDVSF